jgi:predicted acetyltransferase
MALELRSFMLEDEEVALRAWRDCRSSRLEFLTSHYEGPPWPEYLELTTKYRAGSNLPEGPVPDANLAAVVERWLVGRVSMPFQSTEYLATHGGHIGYAVIEEHRRKGYATQTPRPASELEIMNEVSPVLLACDDDNVGAAAVRERCGGTLEIVGPSVSPPSLQHRPYISLARSAHFSERRRLRMGSRTP